MKTPLAFVLTTIALIGGAAAFVSEQEHLGFEAEKKEQRPNIVFILTDDQDVHLSSLDYMPYVKKHLIDQGTYFDRHYCTTAVCCPSRVTLMTGKASHNTNITDVNPPYGGYPKFVAQGFNEAYLPLWLQQGGYDVYYTGKLFNVHTVDNYNDPYPAGFKSTDFLLDPFTYNYLNSTFQHNKDPPVSHEGEYVTDVLTRKAHALLDEAAASADEKPFFLMIAPSAPHADIQMHTGEAKFDAPVSAPRHQYLFEDVKVPRTENFNPDKPSGANWLLNLPPQTQENLAYNDHFHRQRLRALQSVDELVNSTIHHLSSKNLLQNTYILYSSDNGFHIGQHRLQPGKSCGYEEDIHIPFIVRGPGVAKNFTTDIVTSHTDLASTFLKLAGIPLREDSDGRPIPLTQAEIELEERREHVTVEYWGFAGGEGKFDRELHEHNTYKAIRIVGADYNFYYSVWCTNEREFYDMSRDPGQLRNLLASSDPDPAASTASSGLFGGTVNTSPFGIFGNPIKTKHEYTDADPPRAKTNSINNEPKPNPFDLQKVIQRLDSLLLVTKSCKGPTCRKPWNSLHPNGEVKSLSDALDRKYDGFYGAQQRVEFAFCDNGFLLEAEGRMFEDVGIVYGGNGNHRYHGDLGSHGGSGREKGNENEDAKGSGSERSGNKPDWEDLLIRDGLPWHAWT